MVYFKIHSKIGQQVSNFIVLIGPDGAGKTTIAQRLCDRAESVGYAGSTHGATNFEILPTFSQMKSWLRGDGVAEPRYVEGFKGLHSGMQQRPNSVLKSILLIGWYAIDLNLGRFVIRRARSDNRLLCFARYFYDYYFQIANKNTPRWILRLFEFLVPKPDVVFVLNRDASDIYALKPELTIEEIQRQQAVISRLARTRRWFVSIDASKGIDVTVQAIEQWLLKGRQ